MRDSISHLRSHAKTFLVQTLNLKDDPGVQPEIQPGVTWGTWPAMTEGDPDSAIAAALEFEEKPTLDDMLVQIGDDLWTVYGGQRARLLAGMIQSPMREQIRRIAIYTALRNFLERVKFQPADVAKRLNKRGADAEA